MRKRPVDDARLEDGSRTGNTAFVLPTISTVKVKSRHRPYYHHRSRLGRIAVLIVPCCLLSVFLLQEGIYYILLNQLDLGFPSRYSNGISIHYLNTMRPRPPSYNDTDTGIAVVSLHRGWKYWGYFGTWWTHQKRQYARLHGYAYFDGQPTAPNHDHHHHDDIPRQSPWQQRIFHRRRNQWNTFHYLLYIMETYPTLHHVLWLDQHAIVTQATISIHDRIALFQRKQHSQQQQQLDSQFCVVWAALLDSTRPDTGVMLLANTQITRQLIRTSLLKYSEQPEGMDQSFLQTLNTNATYSSCQLLLNDEDSHLLQSHIPGRTTTMLWTPGDWILHLPNTSGISMIRSLYQLLRGGSNRRNCQSLEPVRLPDLSTLPTEQRNRFQSVQAAIRHAWNGYRTVAHPQDDLAPLSRTGISWLNYAATLHDSMDTLYLANLTHEYQEAVQLVTSYDIQTTSLRVTKTFEYSLRVVGGLLGAYSLSGDPQLLAAATRAADALLEGPFQSSPTPLPRPFGMLAPSGWDGALYWLVARAYEWGRDGFTQEHRTNSLAGVGSFSLEFWFLSTASGDPTYRRAADAIFHVVKTQERNGTIPTSWNVMTGQATMPRPRTPSLGSAADSFYEYLLKVPLLADCEPALGSDGAVQRQTCSDTDREMLSMYRTMVRESLRPFHVATRTLDGGPFLNNAISFPVDDSFGYHHLLCFLPGLLALGAAKQLGESDDMGLAKDLLAGCHATYQLSDTGIGPESVMLTRDAKKIMSSLQSTESSYLLRPEFLESLFIMYRLTKDSKLQDIAWEVFQSIETHCKIQSGGYSGLKNVFHGSSPNNAVDEMPSYFIAETLKYLLLTFAPDDYISLDDFVFTTEAHPMRRLHLDVDSLPLCLSTTSPHIPIPWSLLFCLLIISFILVALGYLLKCLNSRCPKFGRKSKYL